MQPDPKIIPVPTPQGYFDAGYRLMKKLKDEQDEAERHKRFLDQLRANNSQLEITAAVESGAISVDEALEIYRQNRKFKLSRFIRSLLGY